MSIAPERLPGDFERMLWENKNVRGHTGKIVTLEQLTKMFPKDANHSEVRRFGYKETYDLYGRIVGEKGNERLAYGCKSCKKIVIGPPEITDDQTLGIHPLSGREGYNINCTNCHSEIDEHTSALS